MTYNPNANWTTETEKTEQVPVYFAIIEGLAFRFSTHPVKGASVAYKPFMRIPSGAGQEVEPLKGESSIGSVSFTLVDEDGSVVDVLSTEKSTPTLDTLINRRVSIYGGYAELNESDFAPLFEGDIESWSMLEGGHEFRFRARDIKRTTFDEVMLNATTEAPSVIQGNPINIWRALITSDFSNANFPVITSGSTPTGLGVSASLIDDEHLAKERDEWLFGFEMQFTFTEPEKAKDFFSKELFILKGYPIIRPSGKMSVRLYHPAHPAEPLVELTEDDIIGVPQMQPDFRRHVNHIIIKGDYNPDGEPEFTTLFEFKDDADIAATRETKLLEIESKGLRSTLDGARNAAFAGNRIKQRYLKPPIEVDVETFFTKKVIEAGEIIFISHSKLPNLQTGQRGWENVACEAIEVDPDYSGGKMSFKFLSTTFGRRYRVIAPTLVGGSPFPDYGLQTQEQRDRFASIAATSTERFTNGDLAHQII